MIDILLPIERSLRADLICESLHGRRGSDGYYLTPARAEKMKALLAGDWWAIRYDGTGWRYYRTGEPRMLYLHGAMKVNAKTLAPATAQTP